MSSAKKPNRRTANPATRRRAAKKKAAKKKAAKKKKASKKKKTSKKKTSKKKTSKKKTSKKKTSKKKTSKKVASWKPVQDETEWADIGSKLLENLAKGIYSSRAVLREYVQNARDAYQRLAEFPSDPTIIIEPDPQKRTLQIFDRGVGMTLEGIRAAKRIAVSDKALEDQMAGFRGIGIWAGFEAADRLEVQSTSEGDPTVYRLTVDFHAIRTHIETWKHIKEVLDPNYKIETYPIAKGEHFTQVTLHGVHDDELLREAELLKIAALVFPCRIDPSFEHKKVVQERLDGLPGYHEYKIHIRTGGVDKEALRSFPEGVVAPRFETLKSANGIELARVWWCATEDKQLSTEEGPPPKRRGFRLRESNISVGVPNPHSGPHTSWTVTKDVYVLPENLKLDWFCGEVHVTHPAIRPNTPREDLEQRQESTELVTELRRFYKERMQEARGRSDFNSCRNKVASAEKFASEHAIELIKAGSDEHKKLVGHIEELKKLPNKRKGNPTTEKKRVLVQLLKGKAFERRRKSVLKALNALTITPTEDSNSTDLGEEDFEGHEEDLEDDYDFDEEGEDGDEWEEEEEEEADDGSAAAPEYIGGRSVEDLLSSLLYVIEEVLGDTHDDYEELAMKIQDTVDDWASDATR